MAFDPQIITGNPKDFLLYKKAFPILISAIITDAGNATSTNIIIQNY